MKSIKALMTAAGIAITAGSFSLHAATTVDPNLPDYTKVSGISGSLNSVGSDTLNNMMTLWSEAFQALYPNVRIQIEGKGSSTAPTALIEGTAQLGPMSRPMKSSETDAFEAKFGYKPTEIAVAIDALAVFVHKDSPVSELNFKQLDSIFSNTYKRGGQDIARWGQLGLEGDWSARPISLYGRNSASGTYGYFKDVVLDKGDYKASVKEQPGSSAVVQGIASDLYGIGYSGIGYKTPGVKALSLSAGDSAGFAPTAENCISGDYPLARLLTVYVNKAPSGKTDPLTYEFLRFVLSKQGQEIVARDGYYPLPASVSAELLKKLQ